MNDEQTQETNKLLAHEHVKERAPKPRYQNEIVLAGMVVAEVSQRWQPINPIFGISKVARGPKKYSHVVQSHGVVRISPFPTRSVFQSWIGMSWLHTAYSALLSYVSSPP
jgi:hypothetical protein